MRAAFLGTKIVFVGSHGADMVRTIGRLKALTVERAKAPGLYPDGGGLWLQIKSREAKSWVFRFIQELLGHASISTTQRYSEVDEAGLMGVYEKAHPRAKLPPPEEPTFP